MGRPVSFRALVCGTAFGAIAAAGVWAQSAEGDPPGLSIILDFSQSLRAGDNLSQTTTPLGDGFLAQTDVGLTFSKDTAIDRFELELGARFEFGDLPDQGGRVEEVINPYGALSYERDGANGSFAFSLSRRETELRDVTLRVLDLETLDIFDLTFDLGSRTDDQVTADLTFGDGGPVEAALSLDYRSRFYDSPNVSLDDEESLRLSGSLRMAVTPNTDVILRANARDWERDNTSQTLSEERNVTLGFETQITPATTWSGALGVSNIDLTEGVGAARTTTSFDDIIGDMALSHELRNGTIGAEFTQTHSRSGLRQQLLFTRDMDLPLGELSFALGALREERVNNTDPVIGLALTQTYKRSALLFQIEQRGVTDAAGATFLNSRAALRYVRELTKLTDLDLRLGYVDVTETSNTGAGDAHRIEALVGVNYELSADWTLTTGYAYRRQSSTGAQDIESNEIFANISRSFDLRP